MASTPNRFPAAGADANRAATTKPTASGEILRPNARGPLGSACMEIRLASQRLATEPLAARRMTSLLRHSDEMLAALEQLNLRRVTWIPESGLAQLAGLVADLPFHHQFSVGSRLSPTTAIDVVFDIQERVLRSMSVAEAEDDDLLEVAS